MLLGLFGLLGKKTLDRARVAAMSESGDDFSGADLGGLDLSGIRFCQREFNGARLAGTRLGAGAEVTQCEFNNADLQGADLRSGKFVQCEFKGANLGGAALDGATFTQCEFEGARMEGVSTAGVSFSQCDGLSGLAPHQKYKSFWDIDDEDEKWQICREHLGRLATAAQGKIKERQDDGEIHVAGHFESRPFRVKTDVGDGNLELQVKFQNRLGVLVVRNDPEKQASPGDKADKDEWDESDRREECHFLAPGVFLEEYPDELEPMKKILALQPALGADIAAFMQAADASNLRVDSELIEVRFRRDLLNCDAPAVVRTGLQTTAAIAAIFESGAAEVAAKPRVYIGGKPAQVGPGTVVVTCGHCNAKMTLDRSRRCPNCGAQN